MAEVDVDVLVVGAGPCGATLANLLGVYGVRALVLDREPDVIDYPRAVAIDDESLRSIQTVGLSAAVVPDLIQNAPIRYHDSRGAMLAHVGPSGQPFGWPRRNLFYQPLFERALRRGLERFEHVDVVLGAEVVALEQREDAVLLKYRSDSAEVSVRARYVVGADGGRSFVRDAVGIELTGSTAPSKWLVVDVEDDTWEAPYSAVYCDPHRPTMTIPLPYARRRFEFKLLPDETEEEVVQDAAVNRLLARFYVGRAMPTVSRRRVYWHHSRIASRFEQGRVFLAGDAAHLQPPFFGQGMNSGIRDATNLAWKLAAVSSGRATAALLHTYDSERRENAEKMVAFATRVGGMYQPRNLATEAVRDVFFRGVQRIPGARDYVLQMKYKPLPRYVTGFVVDPDTGDKKSPVGRMFPQPSVQTADGSRSKLDDILGSGFALVGLHRDPLASLDEDDRRFWQDLGTTSVHVMAPRPLQRVADQLEAAGSSVAVYDIDGTFRDLLLSRPRDEVIVLRPDRYVAAAGPATDLARITKKLRAITSA